MGRPSSNTAGRRWAWALGLALVSDALSFPVQWAAPVQLGLDLATALALWGLLGWRWSYCLALVPEAFPGLASFPSWVVVVAALYGLERLERTAPEPAGADRGTGMAVEEAKILDRGEAAARVARWKAAGGKVVFTNGVFDLLHVGHLRYLAQARALGDRLAVGLNSDSSVRGLKGDKRPILPQDERAELLAGLSCVDLVCVFDEPDPRALIRALRPSVLVKGGDWPVEKILGGDTVVADGGRVLSLPFVPGRSTTAIVESIAERYGAGFKE